jgi:hypothetical protein
MAQSLNYLTGDRMAEICSSDIDDIVQELAEPAAGFDEKNDAGGAKDINENEIIGIKGKRS